MEAVVILRPFEEEIIRDFKTFDPTIGGGKSRPRKGIWIRAHLLDMDATGDYIYRMWERWSLFVQHAHIMEAAIEYGTYTAFRTYIFLLKRHGLVFPFKRERAKTTSTLFFRQYYRVNRRRLEDSLWLNPFKLYPSWRKWQEKGFPRPKKKPKRPKIPGVPEYIPAFLPSAELNKIWAEAQTFLAAHNYTITRADLEKIIPDWGLEVAEYLTMKERVGYVIHEAVEVEEVSHVAKRLIDPRLAPESIALKAHKIAEKMQKEYLKG